MKFNHYEKNGVDVIEIKGKIMGGDDFVGLDDKLYALIGRSYQGRNRSVRLRLDQFHRSGTFDSSFDQFQRYQGRAEIGQFDR
jgi:hypothetical protein